MKFVPPLQSARLIRRYKRFLADVEMAGEVVTVHCSNTGRMLGCDRPGCAVWLSHHRAAHRKYPWTWEIVEALPGILVGINPMRANDLVAEALAIGRLAPLHGYGRVQREVAVAGGRLDFCLADDSRPNCYLEVKSVTAADAEIALFPDAISTRARRHLDALVKLRQAGHRAVLLYCVQREDALAVRPAIEIDPDYACAVADAAAEGVEIFAYRCVVSPQGLALTQPLAIVRP